MREAFRAESIRGDFPGLRDVVHLNSASMGVAPRVALAAIAAQLDWLERGVRGTWGGSIDAFENGVDQARREAARLIGGREDEVGLIGDTTSGLHQAIDAIPFRPGANVVLSDLEYPQVALAARNAERDDGVEIRFVHHQGGRIGIDDYRRAIDAKTRAVLVSSVSWVTGQRADLEALSELAAERRFFLVVDAIQQLGALSLDCSRLRIDFLMAGGYKWLNAPFDVGVLYVRRGAHEEGLRLRRIGLLGLEEPAGGWNPWYSSPAMEPMPGMRPASTVRRFEAQGTPNRFASPGLAAALAYRNGLPAAETDRHVLDLAGELIAALRERRARVLTPENEQDRAGIVTFTFGDGPEADADLRTFLERRSIWVSARYCSGVGGVRAAIHFFNTRADVGALLGAIDEFRANRSRS